MCCLFGFHDYGHKLSQKQRSQLLTTLSISCEERGTDATGIAYNAQGIQHIYKRPLPARKMWYRVPQESTVVMGHTRMTTQGSEKHNRNNHPFQGRVHGHPFSLAHNGVLNNDRQLRKKYKLPVTPMETDSYIAVQLVEDYGKLNFSSLQHMAEQLEGTFTFTALSDRDELYFVKGNNPMCIYHFRELGLYVYASTEQILLDALVKLPFSLGSFHEIGLHGGDILCIDAEGNLSHGKFDDSKISFYSGWGWPGVRSPYAFALYDAPGEDGYLEDLKAVASSFGICPENIDLLIQEGFTLDEIEEYLYCG